MTALQLPSTTIVSHCMYRFFFVNMSFKNLAWSGIYRRASPKGKVISSFLKMLRNLAKCCSLSFLEGTNGYGTSLPSAEVISLFFSLETSLLLFFFSSSTFSFYFLIFLSSLFSNFLPIFF